MGLCTSLLWACSAVGAISSLAIKILTTLLVFWWTASSFRRTEFSYKTREDSICPQFKWHVNSAAWFIVRGKGFLQDGSGTPACCDCIPAFRAECSYLCTKCRTSQILALLWVRGSNLEWSCRSNRENGQETICCYLSERQRSPATLRHLLHYDPENNPGLAFISI